MPQRQEYIERKDYPHMGPKDVEVWTRYIRAYPEAYKEVSYDVKIGFPPAFVTREQFGLGGNTANLYMRKIDVLGYRSDGVDIIEVKPTADFAAVGQILGYLQMWKTQYGSVDGVKLIIVTGDIKLDVRMMAETHGVEVFVV